jgi:hypothetical protein
MRGNLGGPLRLLHTLRGDGTLLWGANGQRPVAYAIDVYGQGQMRTASGDVRGDLAALVSRSPANVRLRFADGFEAPVALSEIEVDTATIELQGPPPAP